ncbi:uncharacterized protein L3040_004564 [Drepanopeziza brunnea f. sp. 'multigermtubi']|uniref:uncharacterized protein n=1 Tax=Drepanopeziza brunnea f. sp. 'multigermtubi' TaxID=698441 RepID=UPI00239A6DE8|nr:hypothetical protein L3040_004564 [Drepanopeziza brunnea f. sp. 'multigermtubi']
MRPDWRQGSLSTVRVFWFFNIVQPSTSTSRDRSPRQICAWYVRGHFSRTKPGTSPERAKNQEARKRPSNPNAYRAKKMRCSATSLRMSVQSAKIDVHRVHKSRDPYLEHEKMWRTTALHRHEESRKTYGEVSMGLNQTRSWDSDAQSKM